MDDVLLGRIRRLRGQAARRVLRHVDHNRRRRFAVEADRTGHRARGRRIDLRIGRRRRGRAGVSSCGRIGSGVSIATRNRQRDQREMAQSPARE